VSAIGWLDRVAGRFNRWLGRTAAASGAEGPGFGGAAAPSAIGAKTALGEIEQAEQEAQSDEEG
jgi:hypothetical protein